MFCLDAKHIVGGIVFHKRIFWLFLAIAVYSGEPSGHWPLFFLFKAYSCLDKDVHATVLGVNTMLFCRLLILFKIYFLKKN